MDVNSNQEINPINQENGETKGYFDSDIFGHREVTIAEYPNDVDAKETECTPNISFNHENGVFEISGRSIPEDAIKFYGPIFRWLDEYSKSPAQSTNFSFKMGYFNTTTSKIILGIAQKLEKISKSGHEVHLKWYYMEDDEEMEEYGEVLSELLKLDVQMIPVSEQF